MNKHVLIQVSGLQAYDEHGEGTPVEMIVPGEYYFRNGNHYLRYEEVLDDSGEPTINYVKVSPSAMEVRKKGLVNAHMVFEKGKKNMTCYTTPFGTIRMGIAATGVTVDEKKESIRAHVDYSLEMNDMHVAECSLTLTAESHPTALISD